ncbi:MAG: DUF2225 domain-containing protein [Defluviitaleaceae bacterium]|nr:DUF2225 domain-containing protein [Defluviitaleaceae bacterium]
MDLSILRNISTTKRLSDGDEIFREGQKTNGEIYVIIEGNVIIESHKKRITYLELGVGDFFGETSLFAEKPHSTTAVAKGEVSLFVFQRPTAPIPKPKEESNTQAQEPTQAQTKPQSQAPATVHLPDPLSESSVPPRFFAAGHKFYSIETPPPPTDIVYKKNFTCPVCDNIFPAYSIRTTRLKLKTRDRDFRSHYKDIDTAYYEIVTCPECYFSMFENMYPQTIISRFKNNIREITPLKYQLGIDITNDRSINSVFAGYYVALKAAPLFYRNYEMAVAKIWLRLMWLYNDVGDTEMERVAAKKAHKAYLTAFEKIDASPDTIQQLCVLIGELSLIVNDLNRAKIFFLKARSYRNCSKALLTQAAEGIDRIREIEAQG